MLLSPIEGLSAEEHLWGPVGKFDCHYGVGEETEDGVLHCELDMKVTNINGRIPRRTLWSRTL